MFSVLFHQPSNAQMHRDDVESCCLAGFTRIFRTQDEDEGTSGVPEYSSPSSPSSSFFLVGSWFPTAMTSNLEAVLWQMECKESRVDRFHLGLQEASNPRAKGQSTVVPDKFFTTWTLVFDTGRSSRLIWFSCCNSFAAVFYGRRQDRCMRER